MVTMALKALQLVQHTHSRGLHALSTQLNFYHVVRNASTAITKFGIKFYFDGT